MPFETTWEARGVVTRWTGHVTDAELLDYLKVGHADPRFDDVRYSIHDFTACDRVSFTAAGIEEFAATDYAGAQTNPDIMVAIVTDRTDVKRMVGSYIDSGLSIYPVRIFPTIESARKWIGAARA